MSLLAVDIGNTNITLGLFDAARRLTNRWSLTSNTSRTSDEYRLVLRQLVNECPAFGEVEAVVIGSVVPTLRTIFERSLNEIVPEARQFLLTPATPLPLRNGYANPEEVGADRLANAVGGLNRFGAPLIVVDFGTATTLDVIDDEPCYLGGIIMPGPRLSAEALNLRTARLPLISPHRTDRVIAANTYEAINAGLYWGIAGGIDKLIEKIAEEAGFAKFTAVATGGLAPEFVEACEHLQSYEADLTLNGLVEIYDFNQGL